ncbi:MAG: protein kinase [Acidobacteria bacterium]|nr:protein kinase [Acidobacteriota bacterium]
MAIGGHQQPMYPASPGTNSCSSCGSINLGGQQSCSMCGSELPKWVAGLAPGSLIGEKYEVISLLGVGGMGEVYKVRHKTLEIIRCVKLMKKSLMEDESFRSRFIREARIATRLQHPNFAIVHEFDVAHDGSYYLVSEFIDGITIRQWSKRHGRFPLDLTLHLAIQVLFGLRHVHGKGLLHRDISADNIMLTLDHDERPVAKIIDLGIAKVLEGPADLTQATQVGVFVGNPKYASPEQLGMLNEDETIDERADLYCLAVVLYEMLAGVPPFTSHNPQGYAVKHLTEPAPRITDLDRSLQVPEKLEDVLLKGLAKRRDQRYQSAKEFSQALRPFLKNLEIDLDVYGEQIAADLPSHQEEVLLREVTPLPSTHRGEGGVPQARTARQRPEEEAWEEADELGTAEAYADYLRSYPAGRHVAQARSRVEELRILTRLASLEESYDVEELKRIAATHSRHSHIGRMARETLERVEQAVTEQRRAEEEAWKQAAAEGTETSWNRYIESYPGSARLDAARQNRDESRSFMLARQIDTEDMWRSYLGSWPGGAHAPEAQKRLDALVRAREEEERAWSLAEEEGTADVWTAFINSYPHSDRLQEAQERIAEAEAFEEANRHDSEKAWRAYLSRWPEGPHASRATERVEALYAERVDRRFAEAIETDTVEGFRKFAEEFPESERAAEAAELAGELEAWKQAASSGSEPALKEYLNHWPRGRHAGTAEARLGEIRDHMSWDAACSSRSPQSFELYLQEFPDGIHSATARTNLEEARAWEAVVDGIEGLRSFLESYPSGMFADAATQRLRELEHAEAEELKRIHELESAGRIDDLKERVAAEGSAAVLAAARDALARLEADFERREREAWEAAQRNTTAAAWDHYLREFSGSGREAEAREFYREAAAFEEAQSADRLQQWRAFLAQWPKGPHATEARNARAALEEKARESSPSDQTQTVVQTLPVAEPAPEDVQTVVEPHPATDGSDQVQTVVQASLDRKAEARPTVPAVTGERQFSLTQPASARTSQPTQAVPGLESSRTEQVPLPRSPADITLGDRSAFPLKPAAIGVVALLFVIAIGIALWQLTSQDEIATPPQDPVVATTGPNLVIDALPWANVLAVTDAAGNNYLESADTTPLSLSVPPGTYRIRMSSPGGDGEITREIEVGEQGARTVVEEFEPPTAEEYFESFGRQ